jgi:hypothetical protein
LWLLLVLFLNGSVCELSTTIADFIVKFAITIYQTSYPCYGKGSLSFVV